MRALTRAPFQAATPPRSIELKDTTRHYQAGDAYAEPIGVLHRAINPEPDIPFICVGFVVTPKDREHVVNVKEPW